MGIRREMRKGFILKSDFCDDYSIPMKVFNQRMVDKGFLIEKTDGRFSIGRGNVYPDRRKAVRTTIKPLHGSWATGTYQFELDMLEYVFSDYITDDKSNYRMRFGKYEGERLYDIPFDYLRWLAKQEFSPKEVVKYIKDHENFI